MIDADAWPPALLRTVLIAACAVSIGVAAMRGNAGGSWVADPALARLLRGMALIKGGIALGAIGAIVWRFALPVSRPVAISYTVGACVLAGSTTLMWQLTLIPLAALSFHLAAIGLLIVGWRER